MNLVLLTAAILGLMLCSGCVPSYSTPHKIAVRDVFGDPIGKISVTTKDRVASLPSTEGVHDSYRAPTVLTTDEHGECEIPGGAGYSVPFGSAVHISVNLNDYVAGDGYSLPGVHVNGSYDGVQLLVDKGKDVRVILKPMDIDYSRCGSLVDDVRRSACLQYSSFFSAIREGNPNICNNYDLKGIHDLYLDPPSIYGKDHGTRRYWDFKETYDYKEACITMTALKKNDRNICNMLSGHTSNASTLKGQCNHAFDVPAVSGILGVSYSEFRRFLCESYDAGKQGESSNNKVLRAGIGLYRWSCQGDQGSRQ